MGRKDKVSKKKNYLQYPHLGRQWKFSRSWSSTGWDHHECIVPVCRITLTERCSLPGSFKCVPANFRSIGPVSCPSERLTLLVASIRNPEKARMKTNAPKLRIFNIYSAKWR